MFSGLQKKHLFLVLGTVVLCVVRLAADDGRSVKLSIYFVYDKYFEHIMTTMSYKEKLNVYFSLLLKAVEKVHFRNLTCTSISLIYIGSSEADHSFDQEMDANEMLEKFRNYSLKHKASFGNPDVTVLVTGRTLYNNSNFCRTFYKTTNHTDYSVSKYRAFCNPTSGVSYYKGICGNNSVAIIRDDGLFRGATGLARQIARLMGANYDVLRKESDCNQYEVYLTSSVVSVPSPTENPNLSQCAEKELNDYIECMSITEGICWKDSPNATIPEHNITADTFFEDKDLCKLHHRTYYKCDGDTGIDRYYKDILSSIGIEQLGNVDPSVDDDAYPQDEREKRGNKNQEDANDPCQITCCQMLRDCPRHQRWGCERSFKIAYPPIGKFCGTRGVCFNGKCWE